MHTHELFNHRFFAILVRFFRLKYRIAILYKQLMYVFDVDLHRVLVEQVDDGKLMPIKKYSARSMFNAVCLHIQSNFAVV